MMSITREQHKEALSSFAISALFTVGFGVLFVVLMNWHIFAGMALIGALGFATMLAICYNDVLKKKEQ